MISLFAIMLSALSAIGFGMLAFLGLNMPDLTDANAIYFYGVGIGLSACGLFTQSLSLRQSPLARAEMAEIKPTWLVRSFIFGTATVLMAAAIMFVKDQMGFHPRTVGAISALLALFTLFAQAMIYTQFKSVPRWAILTTPVLFALYGLAGGAFLAAQIIPGFALLGALFILQSIQFFWGDRKAKVSAERHDWDSRFLMQNTEGVFSRKHKMGLRALSLLMLAAIPIPLLLFAPLTQTVIILVLIIHMPGLILARWLFLAEAELIPKRA